jgi:hypothetical protein
MQQGKGSGGERKTEALKMNDRGRKKHMTIFML